MTTQTLEDRIIDVEELDSERRQSFRMAAMEFQQEAKLKVGSMIMNVQVIDESAGGFLIEVPRNPLVKPSHHVELFNNSGAHLLRVAWRRQVKGVTRIGLQRTLQAPPVQGSSWLWWITASVVIGIGMGLIAHSVGLGRYFN